MILGLAFLLMVSLVLGAAISALGKWWGPAFGGWETLLQIVNLLVGFGLTTLVFAMIYKLMPRVKVQWHDVWLGALVTSLLFTVGKFLIGLYIGKSGVASGFGADLPRRRRVHLGLREDARLAARQRGHRGGRRQGGRRKQGADTQRFARG